MFFAPHLLSPISAEIETHILALPITYDYVNTPYPDGFEDEVDMEALGRSSLEGRASVIPKLEKAVQRWPQVATLKNYLRTAYLKRGQTAKAEEVLQATLTQHPQYLFARTSKVDAYLDDSNLTEARALMGTELDVMAMIPGRGVAHISEVKNYYAVAGKLFAMEGAVDKALGIRSALSKLLPEHDPVLQYLNMAIMQANLHSLQKKMDADNLHKIDVIEAPMVELDAYPPRPAYHHPEIAQLYEQDFSIPRDRIAQILSLPRSTLVADLCLMLEHCAAAAHYLSFHDPDEPQHYITISHALHFLGASNASDALPVVLRFLELHSDLLLECLGDATHREIFAPLVRGQTSLALAWLKQPGVSVYGRERIIQALTGLATTDPSSRMEIIQGFEATLEFYLASEISDNVIDSMVISVFISSLINLRSIGSIDLIQRLWRKNYVMASVVGDLDSVLEDIQSPADPPRASRPLDIFQQYKTYLPQPRAESQWIRDSQGLKHSQPANFLRRSMGQSQPSLSSKRTEPGRNDPCTCGSGKKYKKCCLGN